MQESRQPGVLAGVALALHEQYQPVSLELCPHQARPALAGPFGADPRRGFLPFRISSIVTSKRLAPNRLWVSDFTHVAMWSGVAYVAFAIDAFSRRIVGWKAGTTMKTPLVLDTLEMALWARHDHGRPVGAGLVLHSDAGSQFTSFAFTQRLLDAGVDASIGSVGDAYEFEHTRTELGTQ